jgi:hypothetical protein
MKAYSKCGIVIDPWNYLEHHRPQGMSMTEYVSMALSEIIEWVRERNCHLWLVAHPSKMQKNKDGKLPVPTPHDVSDSAHFWNKADNCITVWRDQSDYTKQDVDIHVQKVRFKHIGHIGVATLMYDRTTGRYHEIPKADATLLVAFLTHAVCLGYRSAAYSRVDFVFRVRVYVVLDAQADSRTGAYG